MEVKLRLEPRVLWRLTEMAERRGMRLSEFAVDVLERQLPRASGRQVQAQETRDRVLALHGEGFTDKEIAAQVGRVEEHVARLRRVAGLSPNKERRSA